MMKLSQQGRDFLTRMEGGYRRHACRMLHNVSRLVIGIGHELSHVERQDGLIRGADTSIPWIRGITRGEAEGLLDRDLFPVEMAVKEIKNLNQYQYDALVSFTFSIKPAKFALSTVRRRLLQNNPDAVPELMKAWIHDEGELVYELIRRRKAEVRLFAEGDYGQPKDWVEDDPVGSQ